MKLFGRIKQAVVGPPAPPEGAHGRRNIDGSYWSVWKCQHGHIGIGDPSTPPERGCSTCEFAAMPLSSEDTRWERCSPEEAQRAIVELEGPTRAYDSIGFELLRKEPRRP